MPKFLEFISKPQLPLCSICNKPVDPETAVADQDGKPVHEECYVLKMRLEDAKKPPTNKARESSE